MDEDYVATPTTCGVGACAATGTTSCVNGSGVDSCAPGRAGRQRRDLRRHRRRLQRRGGRGLRARRRPAASAPAPRPARPPASSGAWPTPARRARRPRTTRPATASTTTAAARPTRTTCRLPTACGVGACAATGTTSCVVGSGRRHLRSGHPGRERPTCDGIDDDCNGAVDEDYVALSTACGVGACACDRQHLVRVGGRSWTAARRGLRPR